MRTAGSVPDGGDPAIGVPDAGVTEPDVPEPVVPDAGVPGACARGASFIAGAPAAATVGWGPAGVATATEDGGRPMLRPEGGNTGAPPAQPASSAVVNIANADFGTNGITTACSLKRLTPVNLYGRPAERSTATPNYKLQRISLHET